MASTSRFDWERAIRALPIRPPLRKLVALMIATYANGNGGNAHPGEDRLAEECGITTRAVRGHLAALREVGLLVRTFNGSQSGRRRLADEYELAIPADVLSRLQEADHRNEGSGVREPITGTSVPDHRNPGAKHRNEGSQITGTRVPPTSTYTKDADQPSPISGHRPASTTGHARETPAGMDATKPHDYAPDEWGLSCRVCGLDEKNARHQPGRAA